MKKLYIIRHAKSSWRDFSLSDFERPLNKRGKRDAPFMGKILKEKAIFPDIILSSPALRAKKTAKVIAKKINHIEPIVYNENIYEAHSRTLINLVKNLDNEFETVLLFGHNPGLNMLCEELVGLSENIPTCGIVAIEFSCDKFIDINASNAKLISFDYPKKWKS